MKLLAVLQIRMGGGAFDARVIQRALGRWKQQWDICTNSMNEEQSEGAGFMRFAAVEFWNFGTMLQIE